MSDTGHGGFEYPDEAGYPDGTGTLSETQQILVDEVASDAQSGPGIDFFVEDNEQTHTYDAISGDTLLGGIAYSRRGDEVTLIATSVYPEFRGQGVATALVQRVLDMLRDEGLSVRVECPIVKTFVEGHPEYASVVARG